MTELSNTKKTTTAKKKTTGGKTSSGAGRTKKPSKKAIRKKEQFIKGEAMAIIACFLAVFLFLSNFNFLGSVGTFTGGIMKGMFGGMSYVFPILVLLAVFYAVSKKDEPLFGLKMGAVCVSILLVPGLIQLILGDKDLLISESFKTAREGMLMKHSAGGLFGTLIANGLRSAIGTVGAYLLLFALLLIAVVIITEKSMIGLARTGAEKTVVAAKKGGEKAKEKIGESRVRRDMRREANALRKKEEKFEKEIASDKPSIDSGRFDLRATEETYNYPVYDSELIGEEMPDGETSVNTGNDRQTGADEPSLAALNEMPSEAAAVSAEPDYGIDEVPFDETEEDRYKAYGKMLLSGKLDSKTAENLGYAVSRGQGVKLPDPVYITPQSAAAAGTASDAATVMQTVATTAAVGTAVNNVTVTEETTYGEEEIYLDDDYSGMNVDDNLHAPALPEEMEYPSASLGDASEGGDISDGDEPVVMIRKKKHEDESLLKVTKVHEETIELSGQEAAPGTRKSAEQAYEELQKKREEERKKAAQAGTPAVRPYQFPPVNLLTKGVRNKPVNTDETKENARKLEEVLQSFGVGVTVTDVVRGPRVTRYELTPDVGVKVSRITALAGDIKLALAAKDLRIEAPIPGKSAVGIEIANKESATVTFRDIMDTDEFRTAKSKLTWGVGLDIQGSPVVGDIAKMPHLLVSGTTGSGKSVGINSIIMSVIYRARPEDVRMILVDPKVVELSVYDGIPHLLAPVVTKPAEALAVLSKACEEMNARYRLFKESNTRNIKGYNEKVEEVCSRLSDDEEKPEKLPYILIIIDELSELMMHSKRDVESAIVSLTQLARAAGIHLVVATQRPSVDVVTGLIKSNIPSRVAYRLPSGVDSRTVLDSYGAESLLGNGDMLYKPGDKNNPLRVQGAYLSDEEVESIVDWLKKHNSVRYSDEWEESLKAQPESSLSAGGAGMDMTAPADDGRDEYFVEAGKLIIEKKKASIGSLQRKFKVGFNRAARIMEQLCDAGVVSEGEGTKERQILMTIEEFREKFGNGNS
ncbi:MAG: DNA translocase FtsK 4TM domain-containing protein [Lachnospiraceae bacterium]|nr:DNA translocase FtsK 4TM domain-containing protein [Lachnospiraceae bacterium]